MLERFSESKSMYVLPHAFFNALCVLSVVTWFCISYGQTDIISENNDQLFGQGLVVNTFSFMINLFKKIEPVARNSSTVFRILSRHSGRLLFPFPVPPFPVSIVIARLLNW